MSDWLADPRTRRDGVTIPTIWVAIALSLLMHAGLLWKWLPQLRLHFPEIENLQPGEASGSLTVHLAPPPGAPPSPPPSHAMRLQSSPALQASPPKSAARPPSPPPVIALNRPPEVPPPPPSTPSIAAPTPARPQAGDFLSDIEARRRARSEPAPPSSPAQIASAPAPVEDEKARTNRIVANNLGLNNRPTFGADPTKNGGGIFQIERLGYNNAEFLFFGWNKDIRHNTLQRIEVQKGNNSDIRLAVVRKMISIIREYEQEDFLWESRRLGRNLTLSARAKDNAGLEEFMLREFPEFNYGRAGP